MRKKQRVLAFVLSLVFTISLLIVPEYSAKAADTSTAGVNSGISQYRWTKANNLDDLPQNTKVGDDGWVPVLFVYYDYGHVDEYFGRDGTKALYSMGNYKSWDKGGDDLWNCCDAPDLWTNPQIPVEKKANGNGYIPNTFVTKGNLQCFWIKFNDRKGRKSFEDDYMKVANTSKKDCALNRYQIAGSNGDGTRGDTILCYKEQFGDDSSYFLKPDDSGDGLFKEWYVTSDSKSGDKFHFFVDLSWATDSCLIFNPYYNTMQVLDTDWDYDTSYFHVYIGEEIEPITVPSEDGRILKSGTVNNFAGTYEIPEGMTLLIQEDAVLIVSGAILNQGTIENHGVILVKNYGCILSVSNAEGKITGNIINKDGDILIKEMGFLQVPQLYKMENSTLINKGIFMTGETTDIQESIIENDGYAMYGYRIAPNSPLYSDKDGRQNPYKTLFENGVNLNFAWQMDNVKCTANNNIWNFTKQPFVNRSINNIPVR